MSFLGKRYIHEKDENFQAFVESLGKKKMEIPEDKKQIILNYKPTVSLKKEGDEYIQTISSLNGNVKELKFKDGVEFDEEISPGNISKTKFSTEGNVVVQNKLFPDGLSVVFKHEYSDDSFVVIITSNNWDGIARRYYKAV